jgi:hypothetical protein
LCASTNNAGADEGRSPKAHQICTPSRSQSSAEGSESKNGDVQSTNTDVLTISRNSIVCWSRSEGTRAVFFSRATRSRQPVPWQVDSENAPGTWYVAHPKYSVVRFYAVATNGQPKRTPAGHARYLAALFGLGRLVHSERCYKLVKEERYSMLEQAAPRAGGLICQDRGPRYCSPRCQKPCRAWRRSPAVSATSAIESRD